MKPSYEDIGDNDCVGVVGAAGVTRRARTANITNSSERGGLLSCANRMSCRPHVRVAKPTNNVELAIYNYF